MLVWVPLPHHQQHNGGALMINNGDGHSAAQYSEMSNRIVAAFHAITVDIIRIAMFVKYTHLFNTYIKAGLQRAHMGSTQKKLVKFRKFF